VVEELLELLQVDQGDPAVQEPDSEEDILMYISKVATTGQTTPHTVRLVGKSAGREVLILVDSGSSHSFISEVVDRKLQEQVQSMKPIAVRIADGVTLSCTGLIPACKWKSHGHEFETNLRVLSSVCYDIVVGMDWLQDCGPMWVDWTEKQLQFQPTGELILLTGVQTKLEQVKCISSVQL
jgi:hypothetical protein